MQRKGFLSIFGITGFAFVINLLILGTLSLLNWQSRHFVSGPPSLRTIDIVHLQPKKPRKTRPETPHQKTVVQRRKSFRKPPRLRKASMDKFLRNVKLDSGPGTLGAPELLLPQKEELTSILKIETGETLRLKEELVDLPPRGIFCKRPEYPRLARLHEIEGLVEVEFVVTTAGTVRDISIIKSVPEGVFNKAVLRALRIWKFEPAQHKGRIVECRCAKRFRFVLTED